MTGRIFTSSAWCRALTLSERHEALSAQRSLGDSATQDGDTGARQLQRWRAQSPFDVDLYFNALLAHQGMTEADFRDALGASEQTLSESASEPPAWLVQLQLAYAGPKSQPFEPPPGEEEIGFLNLIDPLLEIALSRLWTETQRMLKEYPSVPFDAETIEDVLLMNLPDPVLQRLGRTLVLELNVQRLQGQLEGEDARERFLNFVRGLRNPVRVAALFDEYPILGRQLALCINQWLAVSLECLIRLCDDWELLKSTFSPMQDPGPLVRLAGGAGDTHRRGRSVMIAEFDSGLRIVYKPKSLAIDIHFQSLLNWLNDAGCQPPLRMFATLDRTEYGWAEFVSRKECTSVDELHRFYLRQGLYLALLHLLAATDFHYENVIASGEYPMLIDLETMLQPSFDRYDDSAADANAEKEMAESVLAIGLLPMRIWSGDEYQGIDISGLGGASGQLSPDRVPGLEDSGTDAMHYIRERIEIEGDANRPMLDGVEANAIEYIDDIVSGFETMYRLIMERRDELLEPGGPIELFSDDAIRVLLRPTRTYGQLLYESFHPDMLRDAIDRDLFLDRLWLVVPARNHMQGVVAFEQDDLLHGDIPVFTTFPSSLELYDSLDRPIPGVLTDRGIEVVRRRIGNMNEDDLRRQAWYVRSSIATVVPEEVVDATPAYQLMQPRLAGDGSRVLDAARAAADYLCAVAVEGDEDVTWIGLQPQGDQYWAISTQGIDLYGGVPGIALFLAYAGDLCDESRYTDLARKAYATVQLQADLLSDEFVPIGGFEGWGGVLYAFTSLGVIWKDAAILDEAERIANRIWGFIERDDVYDIVRGSAGAIQALLAFLSHRPSDTRLEIATLCGQHLIAASTEQNAGIGWHIERFGVDALTGYGHGASGIASSLLRLYAATEEPEYLSGALQAMEYERILYDHVAHNWPDRRTSGDYDQPLSYGDGTYKAAWCHGSAGIGLARLEALGVVNESVIRDEAKAAIATTLQQGFGLSHCLCHGDFGNLELLLQASQHSDWSHLSSDLEQITHMVLDSIEQVGWQCGGPAGVVLPGLMLGVAGIGYQLLRIAEPDFVPSVLTLAPPAG